jgi:3-hydroxymyristoyl/3-hydroxydecanoyl-(acyl carrier protein) dehydratase
MTQLFQSAIQRAIPHRYPFLLVDRVTEFVPGERIAGIKNFTVNEPAFEGSAAGGDLVPAGIVVEAVTQLGAILVLERPETAGKVALILQIPSAKLLKPVHFGDALRLEARVVKLKGNLGELKGTIFRGEEVVAEGRMRFAVADRGQFLPE